MVVSKSCSADHEYPSEKTSLLGANQDVNDGFGATDASNTSSPSIPQNDSKPFHIAAKSSSDLAPSYRADAKQVEQNSSSISEHDASHEHEEKCNSPRKIHSSYLQTSLLFSINHGALIACLGLANARLGNTIASTSSSILFACYTGFALLGATYVVKQCGAERGLLLGMCLIASYVGSFWWIVVFCYSGSGTEGVGDGNDGFEDHNNKCSQSVATIGGILGGIGSAILWTAQGTFFSRTSFRYSRALQETRKEGILPASLEKVTSRLGNEFAFVFLLMEFAMRVLSSVLVNQEKSEREWKIVFGVYTLFSAGSIIGLRWVEFHDEDTRQNERRLSITEIPINEQKESAPGITADQGGENPTSKTMLKTEFQHDEESLKKVATEKQPLQSSKGKLSPQTSPFRKAVAAIDLLIHDPKMKYLSFINITFGLCTAFTSSVVNGQVIRVALNDENSMYVGFFTASTSCVAAILSLTVGILEWMCPQTPPQTSSPQRVTAGPANKSPCSLPGNLSCVMKHFLSGAFTKDVVIVLGSLSYLVIALLFLVYPSFSTWDVPSILLIYILLGVGRSSYEGTLRAVYADFFPYEKEGAFANIILFNGVSSMVGYWLNVISFDCSDSLIYDGYDRSERDLGAKDLYCVQFNDGSVHNVLLTEVIVVASALLGVWGFWKAKVLHLQE